MVAVDSHELWASRARCCAECLTREVPVGGGTVREYYHRVVVAQWVGVTPPALLDVERVAPGEGEVVAARRLVTRLVQRSGRLIDVIPQTYSSANRQAGQAYKQWLQQYYYTFMGMYWRTGKPVTLASWKQYGA